MLPKKQDQKFQLVDSPTAGSRGTTTGPPRTLSIAKLILNGRPKNACKQLSVQKLQMLLVVYIFYIIWFMSSVNSIY